MANISNLEIDFSYVNLIEKAKVHDSQIAYPVSAYDDLFRLFSTRHTMFEKVYHSSEVQALELMLLDLFESTQPMMKYD